MSGPVLRAVCAVASLLNLLCTTGLALAADPEPEDRWPGLVQEIFTGKPIDDGRAIIAIDMPARAEDAATVPMTLRLKPTSDASRRVMAITLVIDNNPAPMAAKFSLAADAGVSEISTRVRINSYTNVHAVAETSDGKLYAVQTYVKASGGCSAPVAKNAEEAIARLGQMRYRRFAAARDNTSPDQREVQVMVGHPNNSGLQMDQLTQLYIPAFYVDRLQLWQDDSPVLTMDGGISISEDPHLRLTYVSNGAKTFRAEARDTEGHVFSHRWSSGGSAM
jgi:sulfur-oxidizing protein SoxY